MGFILRELGGGGGTPQSSGITLGATSGRPAQTVTVAAALGSEVLTSPTEVRHNGVALPGGTFSASSAIAGQFTVPDVAPVAGFVAWQTASETYLSTVQFDLKPALEIISITPSTADIGDTITVAYHNTLGYTPSEFAINGTTQDAFTVIEQGDVSTQGSLTFVVAAGTTDGPAILTTSGGTATAAADFVIAIVPIVGSPNPASGVEGTVVAIPYSRWQATPPTSATFSTSGGAVAGLGFSDNGTVIFVTAPADLVTGPIVLSNGSTTLNTVDFVAQNAVPVDSIQLTVESVQLNTQLQINEVKGSNGTVNTLFDGATAVSNNGGDPTLTLDNNQSSVNVGDFAATVPVTLTYTPTAAVDLVALLIARDSSTAGTANRTAPRFFRVGTSDDGGATYKDHPFFEDNRNNWRLAVLEVIPLNKAMRIVDLPSSAAVGDTVIVSYINFATILGNVAFDPTLIEFDDGAGSYIAGTSLTVISPTSSSVVIPVGAATGKIRIGTADFMIESETDLSLT